MKQRANRLSIFLAILLLVPTLYVASYVFLLEGKQRRLADRFMEVLPTYRLEADWIAGFYYPLHCLDRRLRPSYWESSVDETFGT